MRISFLLPLFLLFVSTTFAVDSREFRVAWKMRENGSWSEFQKQDKTRSLYLFLDLNEHAGQILHIEGLSSFYVFINGNLVSKERQVADFSIDSLNHRYPKALVFTIYSAKGFGKLRSEWIQHENENYNPKHKSTRFSSFIIAATLILIIFITALLRTNPQLTQDYLNVTRLFNLRDRDDGLSLRITSSVNLLFYFFCSALASLALCIAAHSSGISFMPGFESASVRESFLQWTLFSILIFCFMMLKLMLLMVVSNLFGWKDTVGIQFFNFIRMIILSLVIIALVSIVSFSVGINVNYIVMLKFACLLLATGVITIYFKLLTRATFHFFHLFFYLCATEVLPLLLLTKVLLF